MHKDHCGEIDKHTGIDPKFHSSLHAPFKTTIHFVIEPREDKCRKKISDDIPYRICRLIHDRHVNEIHILKYVAHDRKIKSIYYNTANKSGDPKIFCHHNTLL